jgi:hypothetical protein
MRENVLKACFRVIPNVCHGEAMKEKVKKLNLQRDYKKYLYFIDGEGNVCQKPKSGDGDAKVLVEHAVDRDNHYLYFVDKDGDVARSARSAGRKKAA